MKPELFLLGLMGKELEKKKYGTLLLYMLTAARLWYAQKWKDTSVLIMDEWLQKLMELTEMAKLTTLIKEKNISTFVSTWRHLLNFVLEVEKNKTFDFGFYRVD
uniref:Uncharacterized protein n=1 Tax=Pseudonaja textilis TaxID=8673 RepID=A0A670Y998_PSETE